LAFAGVAASQPGVARGWLLPWRDGNLTTASPSVGVRYVWNQTYSGLRWPDKKTEVLRVASPERAYWRAIVLPEFDGYRWTQGSYQPVGDAMGGTWLDTDRTQNPADQPVDRVSFTVEGLAEPYLLSAGQPLRYELPLEPGPAQIDQDGIVRTTNIPERGTTYAVVTKLTDPKPADLRGAGTSYPPSVTREGLAAFPDMPVPVFGTRNREERMNQLFAFTSANPKHAGWKQVYESVRKALERQQLQTPYDTVIALETYFRTHYAYDEHVVLSDVNGPPLPGWIENGTAGYCQMFSGSMAELLRLLGIPARVAEGFTSGTFDDQRRVWRVTDHDAHAWVEVYFPRYGWLPFDPTPSRSLGTRYSTSSARFALSKTGVVRSADNIGADLNRPATAEPPNQTAHRHGEQIGPGSNETLPAPTRHHGSSLVLDVLAVIAGVLALLLVLKQALRLWRLRGETRRLRRELARSLSVRARAAGAVSLRSVVRQ
jgi:transglutaminase-like putative cysteine protease